MAHSLSAKKRVRQNLKCRAQNRWRKTTMRQAIKAYRGVLLHGPAKDAEAGLTGIYKILDQTAASGAIHKNTASRYKARLAAQLNVRKAASN